MQNLKNVERQLLKRKRKSHWKEVRVGLACSVSDTEKRTYVAQTSKYPEAVGQLVSAGLNLGMSKQHILAVGTGLMGDRVALQANFFHLTFVLNRLHLK